MTNNSNQNIFQQNNNIKGQYTKNPFFLNKTCKNEIKTKNKLDGKARTRCPFSKQEDMLLLELVGIYGIEDKNNWHFIACHIKGRNARQCRERYQLFLSKDIRRKAKWTKEEDEILLSKYKILGPHWKKMEEFFEGRTSYNIKNRFISLNRQREKKGFHLPKTQTENSSKLFSSSELFEKNGEFPQNYQNFNLDNLQIQVDFN